jgi:hypothetical protein
MASTESELQTQVRELTDYTDTQVFSENSLDAIFDIAKRDIQAEADVTIDSWVTTNGTNDAENALFWTACLFTKIKAGELAGVPMSLGDIDVETLKVKGEGFESTPVVWYEKANSYTSRLIEKGSGYAITRVNRRGQARSYGNESPYDGSPDYGGDV